MRNVDEGADALGETKFDALPARVQEALGELVGAAKEGLLALSVGVGLGVLAELMGEEVDDVVGPKGSPRSPRARAPEARGRSAWRWRRSCQDHLERLGHPPRATELTGKRVELEQLPVRKPRVAGQGRQCDVAPDGVL